MPGELFPLLFLRLMRCPLTFYAYLFSFISRLAVFLTTADLPVIVPNIATTALAGIILVLQLTA